MEISQQNWDDCIKVLKILAREPDKSLDTETLKGLVTKIYKKAKKANKNAAFFQKNEEKINNFEHFSNEKIKQTSINQDTFKQYDQVLRSKTMLHQNYEQNVAEEPLLLGESDELVYPKKCYTCKKPNKKVHFFYHLLCPQCADFNYSKRNISCDLKDRVALVTGARIKIGYLTALKMLRAGAKVWVTTRFAKDCAIRFSGESDFEVWADRLKIVALDFRNLNAIQSFIQTFSATESHLDIIINNAAQTIKRPAAFYQHLFEIEQQSNQSLPEQLQKVLFSDAPFQFLEHQTEQKLLSDESDLHFPKGDFDKHKQQIDKRSENSWTLLLEKVTPIEMLETQLVNVTAPFMLNSLLKPMLEKSPFERKFIVNVSAMEGQFNRASKTPNHPHTNMAKAALNMMTRTSAQDYAKDNIFMNSVDTGWITQENPYPTKEKLFHEDGFVPPLDEIDGMARILDPIFSGLNEPEIPLFGHFLKDYKPYFW